LDATAGAPSEARRESEAAATLDAVSAAWSTLLRDYGVQQAGAARERRPLQWGVTFDTTTDLDQRARGYVDLLGAGSSDGWVRLVFDGSEPAASYRDAVRVVHANGLKVNGLLLDSSEMGELSLDAFTARTQEYVDGLPEVDQWEIGNEVNGEWLGPDVVPKISSAAAYVKARGKPTLLTLYWQLGEGDEEHSMFTWAAQNLGPELLADIDVLGLSVYPEDHPMGPATFDRVLETLHARYPDKRLAVTELGYWSEDLGHQWWYGSATDPTGEGRRAVARLYQSAILGYPYSAGGAYWWYYAEEAPPGSALWAELRSIRREAS
jgi:hypothetical protein